MDKQDFQEQDFMEILMRLPCHNLMIVFYLQGECFLFAVRNISTCREKHFYLQSEKLLVTKDRADASEIS